MRSISMQIDNTTIRFAACRQECSRVQFLPKFVINTLSFKFDAIRSEGV